ncbi:tetratricopeptide repeat protein, partial [Listeria monocytogenes]|nr:tetratricopeptide repeat protein [Listeria monocytogenes]
MSVTISLPRRPVVNPRTETQGMHRLLPMAFERRDMTALWQTAIERITADASDAAAMIDLSMMLYCHFRAEEARTLLDQAVAIQRD